MVTISTRSMPGTTPPCWKPTSEAAETARKHHIPALVHVTEATQPLGHSTSGSHERYKTPERLAWEAEYDCLQPLPRNG